MDKRKPIFWGVAAIGAVAVVGYAIGTKAPTAARARPAVTVSASLVRNEDLQQTISALGNVLSLNNVLLRPQIDGVLTKVLVHEGEQVQRSQLLALIDDRALGAVVAQSRAEKSRNEANLKIAELNLKRDQNLLAEQAISSQTVDEQRALVEQLKATLQSNDAALNAAEIQQSYARITSPVSGKVGMRRVDPGNLVHANDVNGLFSVIQIDPISVVFSLPQQSLVLLQPLLAHPEGALVIALDRDAGTVLATGTLAAADNQIDTASGTIQLRAIFPNSKATLWPGEFVTVELHTGTDRNAVTVNARAIQHGLNGTYVFRIRNSTVAVVPVKVRYEAGGVAALSDGLAAGDLVVTEGQDQLTEGAAVAMSTDHDDADAVSSGVQAR